VNDKPKRKRRPIRRVLLPEEWTEERHPEWGSREELARYFGSDSLTYVDALRKQPGVVERKLGALVKLKVKTVIAAARELGKKPKATQRRKAVPRGSQKVGGRKGAVKAAT
jgi:hypothetical protein